ncbi:MAG: Uma2 family endonuclease [Acidobacteria bacterium]|nr:Uma2 family endonuclease [Acidobacteriota bacterium]
MAVEVSRRRFTADEYQAMGRAGILREDDRVELIDGEVLAMSPIGPPHVGAVNRLNHLFGRLVADDAIVQVQLPVRLDPYSEPQPDLVLLKPRDDFYGTAAAGPADILLAVEVSQSSLAYDRGVKAALYARRGVAEYWIVDLVHGAVIRHTDPVEGRYRHAAAVAHDEPFAPALLPTCIVTTRDIFG